MKARKHRGSFAESMETMEEFEPTWENIEKYFQCPRSMLTFDKSVYDARQGWESNTYHVIVNNAGVLGMVDYDITS